jgi:hypothetical protein
LQQQGGFVNTNRLIQDRPLRVRRYLSDCAIRAANVRRRARRPQGSLRRNK